MKNSRGTTVLELLCAIAFLAIILMVLAALYSLSVKQYVDMDNSLLAQYSIRQAKAQIVGDIVQCRCWYIDPVNTERLNLWLPETGDYRSADETKVSYYLSGDQLMRRQVSSAGTNTIPVASNISLFSFAEKTGQEGSLEIHIHSSCGNKTGKVTTFISKKTE